MGGPIVDAVLENAPGQDAPRQAGAALALALAEALDAMAEASAATDAVEMVHDARKSMKQYRALLRLVPGEEAAAARRRTAAVARELSGSRDRAAALEALDALDAAGFVLAIDHAEARAALGEAPAETQTQAHRDLLDTYLVEARAALDGPLGAAARAADVGAGLAKGYRQARRARFDTPGAMHEARKRVVAHRYQMSFLADAFRGTGARRARRVQQLRDLFGAYQDIETLRPMLETAGPALAEGTRERLALALARAQKRLRKQAMKAHAKLFRRSPRAFAERYADVL